MSKVTIEKLDKEDTELLASIEKNLRHDVKVGLEYGFDVKSHWKEMLASLDEEKAEIK